MKRLLVIALMALPLLGMAEVRGKVYGGHYFGSNVQERAPNDRSTAPKYTAGIYLETDALGLVPYTSIVTQMDDYYGEYGSFHPSQVEYTVGVYKDIKQFRIKVEHQCTHGIDKWTGVVDQYNKVQLEYRFGGYSE